MATSRHPQALHWFSTVHFFERFSYYGIKSLLLLYLTTKLDFSDAKSYAVFGVFGTLTYATPLVGGYVADKMIGFYASLWAGLIFVLIGHVSIFVAQTNIGLFLGLGLIAIGSGLYKSNMNVLIGNLYDKASPLKDAAYTIFYVYQNAGSFFAPLICGYVGLQIGWFYGFSIAGIGCLLALIILYKARKFKRPVHGLYSLADNFEWKKALYIALVGCAVAPLLGLLIFYGQETLDLVLLFSILYFSIFFKYIFALKGADRRNMFIVFLGIIAIALSGALISHGGMVFTLFMSRNVDPYFLGLKLPVTFIQSIDPLTIVILGPLFAVLWRVIARKRQKISEMAKILVGFAVIAVAYFYFFALCEGTQGTHLVALVPFAIGVVVLSASDLLIYPNVLTFCSHHTPKELIGVVMGFVVFGMSLSQVFATYLAKMAATPVNSMQEVNLFYSLDIYQTFFAKMGGISFACFVILLIAITLMRKRK